MFALVGPGSIVDGEVIRKFLEMLSRLPVWV